ncbi:LamG domain-containing protein [Halobacteriovorax sp. HLS]|uniref:LamG domain-containing protein n=1 Tax=Halobacteriovorax sp. HLS TaxID=2234000 RepID=UPI000FD9C345|nr:LamG domain-containing protein [Halobacteriovorax sp. HLS]
MKKYFNQSLFVFLILSNLFLISCSSEDEQAIANIIEEVSKDIPEGDIVNPSEVTEVISRKSFLRKFRVTDPIFLKPLEERIEALNKASNYHFDIESGKCFDIDAVEARGESDSLECNIPAAVESENYKFSHYNFFGADARGASVKDAEVSIYDLVFAEVQFDINSILNSEKRPFYQLFHNHKRVYYNQKNMEEKYSKALKKYQERKRTLKKKFRAAKTDKAREGIKNKILKTNEQIELVKLNHKIARKKASRHLKELKWISKVDELEQMNETFSGKNKKFAFFDGSMGYSFAPSNEVLNDKNFTVSLWFRTLIDQQDKRLINFHREASPGSALNLSLKKGKVVMGLHNGTNYISNEVDFEYDDGVWHHFAVTKSKKGFIVYIDGEKSLQYTGEFSGLGAHPVVLGSYNGQGYFYSGDLDEVSIWSRSLSKKDIREVYNSGVPGNIKLHTSSTFINHWWRLGDHKKDSDNSFYDSYSKQSFLLVE